MVLVFPPINKMKASCARSSSSAQCPHICKYRPRIMLKEKNCLFTVVILLLLLAFTSPCEGLQSSQTFPPRYIYAKQRISSNLDSQNVFFCSWLLQMKSRKRPHLHSTPFDDDDLDWGVDDDEDELDIQVNSLFDKREEKGFDNDGKAVDITALDDTDEAYYEQLYLQQSSVLEQKNMDVKSEEEVLQVEEIIKNDETGSNEEMKDRYEKMVTLRKEWKEKVHQMRNESIQTRKLRRKSVKRNNLEERASLLALRALRLQTVPIETLVSRGREIEFPVPTLSISSSRNYKRRGEMVDENEIKLEQKLYGKRFKTARDVYTRLLEVLEEMRLESMAIASEFIADCMEEEVSVEVRVLAGAGGDNEIEADIIGTRCHKTKRMDEVAKMNEIQQKRMKTVVHLSLNGPQVLKKNKENSSTSTINIVSLQDVDTVDLQSILRIRGNIKRRGRLPKTRTKVLEHLNDSFSQPLF